MTHDFQFKSLNRWPLRGRLGAAPAVQHAGIRFALHQAL
jgi:hypothetical protein